MGDLIDTSGAVSTIVSGTSNYLVSFAPFFLFVLGFALALSVITALLQVFYSRQNENQNFSPREVWEDIW